MSDRDHLSRLTRRLQTNTELNQAEIDRLESLPLQIKTLTRFQDVVQEGEHPTQSCVVLRGWLFRYRILESGRRQILSFHVAGEMPDLHSIYLEVMDHSLAALTPCEVALVPHRPLQDLVADHPRIGAVLWRDTLIDAGIFREWMVGIGRRSAFERLSHLICEMYLRLARVGLARDHSLEWPVTRSDLGDATGMTSVHVTRMLGELRRARLITLQGSILTILDWDRLVEAAGFDASYLHLRPTS
ncbi:Crp/Fnr family transcriptional regulator [Methylobacterium sp. C25]|uniref:Crp/Fnr family transcriptional regulator n=1 Tax=Methylobacterium sp. C25 TaxID=2721622 RepID=UPI001F38526F|nr:Crp/Fnr family transcriptional regulator [Methylobacterium sp. C25]